MPDRADVEALMERLDGLSESQADWYTALVLVALDDCEGDLGKALDRADSALFDHPDPYARGGWLWPLRYGWEEQPDKTPPPSALKKSPNAKVWKGTPPDKGYRYQISPPGSGRGKATTPAAPKPPGTPPAPKAPRAPKAAAGPSAAEMQAHLSTLDPGSLDDAGMQDLVSRLSAMPQAERANLKRALGVRLNAPTSVLGQAIRAKAEEQMQQQPPAAQPREIFDTFPDAPGLTDDFETEEQFNTRLAAAETARQPATTPAPKAPRSKGKAGKTAAPQAQDMRGRVSAALRQFPELNDGNMVYASKLTAGVAPEDRPAFDAAMLALAEDGILSLAREDHPGIMSDEDRAAAIHDPKSGTWFIGVNLRGGQTLASLPAPEKPPEPAPSAPPGKPAVTDQHRQSLLRALDQAGGDYVHLGDLARATGMDKATLHATMDALRQSGEITASGHEGRHGSHPQGEWHKDEEGSQIAYLSRRKR